ncbi:MAG: thiamine/thiamine pyrophosphate ABC transporter permease ThiP, partial [Pseudomonadota bacterium]
AIYQAVRFEFDLPKAAALAVIQVMLCLGAATLTLSVARPVDTAAGLDRVVERWDAQGGRASDATIITVAAVFLTLPLAMVVWRGVFGLFDMPPTIWRALATSLLIALPAAGLAVAMAGALAALILRMGARVPGVARGVEAAAILALAVSPFVMGTGLFLILNPWTDPFAAAIPVTVAVNAVLAMPFGLRVLLPALRDAEATQGRLGRSLGLSGWRLFRVAIWPRIRRAVGFSMGLAAALSMGDLGVITLFAPPGVETLPLAMYRLMGSYRTAGADGAALVLVAAAFALLWLFDRGGRVDDPL